MSAALCLVFLVSGAAALMFETLWFRQAGLALGNTVWTSALVTSSFMAGLAVGSAAVARWGGRLKHPLRAYALLELLVGATGVSLVVLFPSVGGSLAPLMGSLGEAALGALRVAVSFALLLIPSCAMGATLPLLAAALAARDPNFGRVLGRLYGWNTLGAVAGTLVGDLVLIEAIGIRHSAFVSAGLNGVAAAGAALVAWRFGEKTVDRGTSGHPPVRATARRLLAAAGLSGGILLALEVVWFRLLLLFTPASAWDFAVMLAVVLLGIATGGLAAAALLGRRSEAHRWAALPALLAALGVAASYASFLWVVPPPGATVLTTIPGYFRLALPLMLPGSFLSGVLFTVLGRALHAEMGESTRSAGLLTLANTVGAAAGALLSAFALLPLLGVERSVFTLALLYGAVGLLSLPRAASRTERVAVAVAGVAFALAVTLFPFGLMARHFVPRVASRWAAEGYRPVAYEEGVSETVMVLRRDAFAGPESYRLITNGMAMAGTNWVGRRYMAAFVWLPVAVHPAPRRALLISYGLGTTARALVETRELERIDVVDTSASVLRLSAAAQQSPPGDPLRDPRVHVHVEDGRFFLLTTERRYDIITAEPPPPKAAGISSLYSREYFALARSRLAEGGVLTYWLPVHGLEAAEMRAVVGGFCAVFEDCSLWSGAGLEWVLMGTRGARGPVSADRFAAQWRDPVVSGRLREAGLDDPAQLGTLFLADGPELRSLTGGAPLLDDDHPYRLSPRVPDASATGRFVRDKADYVRFMQVERPLSGFFRSELVSRLWPEAWRETTRPAFLAEDAVNAVMLGPQDPHSLLLALDRLLETTTLYAPVLWATRTSAAEVRLASAALERGENSPSAQAVLGLDALARRDYREAARRLALGEPDAADAARIRMWRVLALGLAGDGKNAAALLHAPRPAAAGGDAASWQWLESRFGR